MALKLKFDVIHSSVSLVLKNVMWTKWWPGWTILKTSVGSLPTKSETVKGAQFEDAETKLDWLFLFQTVIPLNETTGIIEWVENLQPLRLILSNLYKEKLGKNAMRQEEIK